MKHDHYEAIISHLIANEEVGKISSALLHLLSKPNTIDLKCKIRKHKNILDLLVLHLHTRINAL